MLVKEIKYTDFNGVEATTKAYFNLTKSELMEMELTTPGGMRALLLNLAETNDTVRLMKYFKKIILTAYGVKSDDGHSFKKSKKISKKFVNSAAYDALFIELFSDVEKLTVFIKGLLPKDLMDKLPDDATIEAEYEKLAHGNNVTTLPASTNTQE